MVIPCSKYHAHRALILASLAPGTSYIKGLSDAGHVRHTIGALRKLGTRIEVRGDEFVVHGGQYSPRQQQVSVGSSGTTLYFMTGLVSLADAPVTVVGQKYFQRRPIGPLLEALSTLGVRLDSPTNCPPIEVQPKRPTGGHVRIPGTLSQWISGLLLLAPFATGPSTVTVEGEFNERSYIDLTIRMMAQFGLHVDVSEDGRRYEIAGNQEARPASLTLPPDIGAAAFGLAATALHPSDVLFRGLPAVPWEQVDHPESDLLRLVAEMGLPMTPDPETGLVRVRHDGVELSPIEVDCRSVPDMLPVLSVLSAFGARGTTVLDNVAHVRLKESDRVSAMLQLNRMGGRLEARDDQLLVHGVGIDKLAGADLSSFNDHRVLMALAIAGTRAEGETRLTYPNAYRISYPRFLDEMNAIGLDLSTAPGGRESRTTQVSSVSPGSVSPSRAASTPIGDLVRRWARQRPTDEAIIDVGAGEGQDQTLTWKQLDERVDAVATMLLELGVAPGEPVAFQLPNRVEFVVLSMAIARIGAVSCPLMPIFRQREMAFMLRRSRARVFVVPAGFRGRDYPAEVAALLASDDRPPALAHVLVLDADGPVPAGTGPSWHDYAEAVARQVPDHEALDARRPEPTALAQLLFTSGTSGEPKGVLHRMDALTRAAAMEVRHLGLGSDDRIFIPSPLAHQTGFLYGMWLAVVLGVPQILQPIWSGHTALSALRRHRGTFVQAATPFLGDLVEAVEQTGETTEALRIFVATGTAVPRGLAERATRTLGAAVCGAWGSTETCLGSLSAPGDEPAKVWGTDGRALVDVRLRITDDDGNVLAPGQEGNFEVSSRCLFEGYLDHPEWTAEALTPDGWYRSGDLAIIDESGFVHISGRVKDVVNRGGEKVPVAEIEQLLYNHPAVRDVAIVAMPDPRLGERACAFAVIEEGASFDMAELQRFLDERQVAKQYWPERLEIASELPRNPTGKVQKFLLRQQVQRLIDGEGHK
ncbi:3-phosphoshikimate 1-carboxyvinyltransferase [Rugosimonospora acidiphila]|uniref:3-phosphoshikimate 1-carboxyvinyltransferase n=1 Tax=Rugosimonospora acidiphila TaxID=556531 RepID=A0ABP9SQ67_9ACTN